MRKQRQNFSVFIGVVVIIFINMAIGEFLLRAVVFSKIQTLAPLRKAQYFSRYDTENYQKLNAMFLSKESREHFPHSDLGWIGNFSPVTYRHLDENKIDGRRVVLLFGDSFANCMNNPISYQDLLDGNNDFSKSYYLLNYAVDGYGIDQIYLLLTHVLELYEDPIVLFTFTTIDMDRTLVRLAGQQKPFYTVEGDSLSLQKPEKIPVEKYLINFPPDIKSYLFAFLDNGSHLVYQNYFRKDTSIYDNSSDRLSRLKALNERLLNRSINLLNKKEVKYKVIVFHTNWRGESPIDRDDWRDSFLKDIFQDQNVTPVWAKSLVQEDAGKSGNPFHNYFLGCGHPSTPYIKLVNREITSFLGIQDSN